MITSAEMSLPSAVLNSTASFSALVIDKFWTSVP